MPAACAFYCLYVGDGLVGVRKRALFRYVRLYVRYSVTLDYMLDGGGGGGVRKRALYRYVRLYVGGGGGGRFPERRVIPLCLFICWL